MILPSPTESKSPFFVRSSTRSVPASAFRAALPRALGWFSVRSGLALFPLGRATWAGYLRDDDGVVLQPDANTGTCAATDVVRATRSVTMPRALSSLQNRLAPAEEIFFTWLMRVFAAGTLVGSAWIDDAPPLELAAMVIAIYIAIRVVMQFGRLAAAAPFENRPLRVIFAVGALVLLGLSFLVVVTLVERLAVSIAG